MEKKANKIQQLLDELCPDGVEVRKLGEIAEITTGDQLNKTKLSEKGLYPVYNGGISPSGYYDDYNTSENTIAISQGGASSGFVSFIETKFWAGAHCYRLNIIFANIHRKFLFYYLKNSQITLQNLKYGAGIPGIKKSELVNFPIPLPPLAVQEEIVRILDKFTELIDLLEKERELRIKQYEYYREKLLTFGDEVPKVALGDISTIIRGSGLKKSDFTESGVPCIHYGQIYTYYNTFVNSTKSFVSRKTAENLKKINKGDIVMAVTSENIEDVCKCVVWLGEEEIVTGGHTAIIKHSQNPKYLAYWFQTNSFFEQKCKIAQGTKVIEVTPSKLMNIKVPVPPLKEQERIVAILDRFDALCNDLTSGLPAEIELRRKQYEYYREKLLTFKIKES